MAQNIVGTCGCATAIPEQKRPRVAGTGGLVSCYRLRRIQEKNNSPGGKSELPPDGIATLHFAVDQSALINIPEWRGDRVTACVIGCRDC
jgi:hypothetical protein